jgi:hypothetical protein
MTALKLQEIQVQTTNGEPHQAVLGRCGECDSDVFHVFQLEGQSHMHIQCNQCLVSFCPGGQCQ